MSKTAIILCGGLGTRLKPFTEIIPKPLLPIGEKSVLEIQIERLKQCGFNNIILATNYKSEYIERFFRNGSDFGVTLEYSKETKPLGTAGPLTLLKDKLNEPFLVMNGDILSLVDFDKLYQFAIKAESPLILSIKKHVMPYAFGNIFFNGDFVTGFEEKPDIERYILAGIYIMKPEIFNFIPDDTYFGMDSLIKALLDKQISIIKYELKEYWLDIGQIDDYEKAQNVYKDIFEQK